MRKLSIAFAFCVCVSAQAEWTAESARSEFSADRRVEHRHVVVRSNAGNDAVLDLALFSSKSATLRVIDNAMQDGDLAAAMEGAACVAGVNGAYFDPQFAPIGLRIIDGKTTSPLVHARLLTGVLAASRERGVEIVRLSEFPKKAKLDAAVECGPFLVEQAAGVKTLNAERSARRTFAAVTRDGHAGLGYCDDATLAQLSEILAAKLIDRFPVWRAMNLDGGSSSAFWFRRADGSTFSIGELKTVRDFVGVAAK